MKNLTIQNRVLQRDRVLQRRVLERYYCTLNEYFVLNLKLSFFFSNIPVVSLFVISIMFFDIIFGSRCREFLVLLVLTTLDLRT